MCPISDYHVHTNFSDDSDAGMETMILRAVSLKLPSICFTDHNDFDFPIDIEGVIFRLKFDEYVNCVHELAQKYISMIPVRTGVEQGLMKSVSDRVNAYDPEGRLDFIIGSSHLVYGEDPYNREFWNGKDIKECILSYYESILENLNFCSNFDVYGHLDYITRFIPYKRLGEYNEADYYDVIDAVLDAIIKLGKGIEINTSGFIYNLNATNPSEFILKRYHELGGEIITTGSDAHTPENVAFRFNILSDILKNAGFKYYTEYVKRQPQFIKLE